MFANNFTNNKKKWIKFLFCKKVCIFAKSIINLFKT